MTTKLFAQPYDISANGFYFDSAEEYQEKSSKLKNHYGAPVEEFEIQFIDGEGIDCELFNTLSICRANISKFFEIVDTWERDEKIRVIISVGQVGYKFDLENDTPDQFYVDLYQTDSFKELAEHFVEEGLFGDIPEHLKYYLDYDKISSDLEIDYSKITIDGEHFVYRCD